MTGAGSEGSISDPIGQDFGPYELVRRLGVGGMAETYEAIRRGPGEFTQRVCLKVVLPYFRDRPDFQELFMREARLAAKLRHSNIVGVIDFDEINGVPYIALQLVDGVDLASLLDAQPTGRLSHEHVAFLGHELAAALEHAHDPHREGSLGDPDDAIIHRDLSPSNVLVSGRGEILLTDFGLAKAVTGTSRQQSAVKGKVPYMSPEQLRAEKLDGRSDLFALGIVLFEALSGQRPFQGEHAPATITSILEGQRPSLHELAPTAPTGLCDAIESLLETDRNDRPDNAAAVRDMIGPLVPPPHMGRQLGKMALEVRTRQAERFSEPAASGREITGLPLGHPGEASGVGQTGGSLVPGAELGGERPASRVPLRQRFRRRPGWALWTIVAIVAAISLWPDGMDDPQKEVTIHPVDTGPTAPVGTATEETGAAKEPAPAVPAPKPGRLTVIVFPWGDVWIDGKPRGAAPLKNVWLKPGHYRISAGQGQPSHTKTVDLREAQRKTIEFDLTE